MIVSVTAAVPSDRRGVMDRNGPLDLPNIPCPAPWGLNPLTATAADQPRFTAHAATGGSVVMFKAIRWNSMM